MAQAPFPISPALVAIANDYAGVNRNARGYIADRVAPRMPVEASLFRYNEYPIGEAFTVYDNQVDRLGRLNEITSTATETTGETKDYGILEKVPFRDEAMQRSQTVPMPLKVRAVRHVIDVNQLAREIRVASTAMSAASYLPGYTVDRAVSGVRWSDYANSDPAADVRKAQLGMMVRPNVGVTSEAVMDVLSRHPKLSVALGGAADSGRTLTNEEIARALKLDRIEIGSTIKQTSKRGQNTVTGPV
jgi:hypothetical protein